MAETLHFSTHYQAEATSIPLVLLHGWGLNSAVWQPLIAQLSADFKATFHIITIDLPGFGENVDNKLQPYSLVNITKQIDKTIEQPAIYLGWSLGGLVATEMALTYTEKVLGLITVASSPRFLEEAVTTPSSKIIWPGIKPTVLNAFHQQLQVDTKKTISGFLKIQAMGSPHIRDDIKQISQLVLQQKMPSKATLDQSLALLAQSDYRQKLAVIEQPFLRLYGSADSLVPKTIIEQVANMAKHSEHYLFEYASHAPFISHLDDFSKVLTTWLIEQFSP
ncbi:pimeloyl-[acyl-carrier protein] methyl ester esterase [Colwellia sp. 39_35_sub15_T18]|nr:pimeloyl-[acyl-carrier protein] methyl ester esterase [Colwellia sp. 39_35_sub15_T18]